MSEEWSPDSVIFVKVDTDEASDVIKLNQVKAFPTFAVINTKGETVYTQSGFNQAKVAEAMESSGAVRQLARQQAGNKKAD